MLIPNVLPSQHRQALAWFEQHEGKTVGWPIKLTDDVLLANRAKGIYKPVWSNYALSVKQTLSSSYADREPKFAVDGTWSYYYYQEEQHGKDPEQLPSNKAMYKCMRDEIPIGVLRQLSPKPNVVYSVLGLAKIVGKTAGYYLLESCRPSHLLRQTLSPSLDYSKVEILAGDLEIADTRIRRLASVVQRQGQPKFREKLLDVYGGRCAISNCDVMDVLEAAHVMPYRGAHTNEVSNGILLRADLHILFDEGLLGIRSDSFLVELAPSLQMTNGYYAALQGTSLRRGQEFLDEALLNAHWHYCGFD